MAVSTHIPGSVERSRRALATCSGPAGVDVARGRHQRAAEGALAAHEGRRCGERGEGRRAARVEMVATGWRTDALESGRVREGRRAGGPNRVGRMRAAQRQKQAHAAEAEAAGRQPACVIECGSRGALAGRRTRRAGGSRARLMLAADWQPQPYSLRR